MNDPRGSNWRKWDLHVHTPASLKQEYGGNTEEAWEKFLTDIESLPEPFKVIGVNDYIFIDGYRRMVEAKGSGRLQNIELILPVVELRVDRFGGSSNKLSRVNFHVIFSNEVTADVIQSQFLNGLSRRHQLTPEHEGDLRWGGMVTRESLQDLGRRITESTPPEKRQATAPLAVGFNNINFGLDNVYDLLDSPYFRDKHLTAVGKNEWADIRWNEQAVAEKKSIVNRAHLVFTAVDSALAYQSGRSQLRAENVNAKLLDCSDAHHYSHTGKKDRIGNCLTWIKADPTFQGLRQTLEEFDERVFVGEQPHKLAAVRANRTKYVKSLHVRKKTGSPLDEAWFDGGGDLEFNHSLVAVIGNKGNAKSALTDVIGLLGNTRNDRNFSFLTKDKFRQRSNNKAAHFEAILTWEDGTAVRRTLDEEVPAAEVEAVKYIPQNFFEVICNEVAVGDYSDFDRELEQVIFSHVEIPDRLGKSSLRELIEHKTKEISDAITQLRLELQGVNAEVALAEDSLTDERRLEVQNKLDAACKVLEAHRHNRPAAVPDPSQQGNDPQRAEALAEVEAKKGEIKELERLVKEARGRQKQLAIGEAAADKARQKLTNFQSSAELLFRELGEDSRVLGLEISDLVKTEINFPILQEKAAAITAEKSAAAESLDPEKEGSLPYRKKRLEEDLKALQSKLAEPDKEYQKYLRKLEHWATEEKKIIGGENDIDTVSYFEAMLKRLEDMPEFLKQMKAQRADIVRKIHEHILKLAGVYKALYAPVQRFISEHPLAKDSFSLNFDVSVVESGFRERFFEWVSQGVSGSFCGTTPGKQRLDEILASFDFNSSDETLNFLTRLMNCLEVDTRTNDGEKTGVAAQLRRGKKPESFYDYVFSLDYLKPHYVLKMGDKEMSQLSPGEKGALLLVFYLLVDRADIPLIIDQPEENLDNQTVYNLLVPSIKEAKRRRQIFIVTHNPNLAVVCDAEQIIYASLDKKNKYTVTYTPGAIENLEINRKVLDVLEGTRPAFDNRNAKYLST